MLAGVLGACLGRAWGRPRKIPASQPAPPGGEPAPARQRPPASDARRNDAIIARIGIHQAPVDSRGERAPAWP